MNSYRVIVIDFGSVNVVEFEFYNDASRLRRRGQKFQLL